jgi:hypothetical protein
MASASSRKEPRATSRWLFRTPTRAWDLFIVLLFAAAVLAGITTSSVGVVPLRDDPQTPPPGLLLGSPDEIRSDEFIKWTPRLLGRMQTGDVAFITELSFDSRGTDDGTLQQWSQHFAFPDVSVALALGTWAPQTAFAMHWWLPVLLVALLLPRWFLRLGTPSHIGIPITAVVIFSPFAIWWSWLPLACLGWTLLAGIAAARVARSAIEFKDLSGRGSLTMGLVALVAAAAAVRATQTYQAWSLPLALVVITPLVVAELRRPAPLSRRLFAVAAPATLAITAIVAYVLIHAERFAVLSRTVHPGGRREAGALADISVLLGAPHMWVLQRNPQLAETNISEMASAYTVLGAAALAMIPFVGWRRLGSLGAPIISVLVVTTLLALWCLVDMPSWTRALMPLSAVPHYRMAQVIGIPALLAFGLMLGAMLRSRSTEWLNPAIPVAFLVGAMTAIGGGVFRARRLPDFEPSLIILGSILFAAATGWSLTHVHRRHALLPLMTFAAFSTVFVGPMQRGFADLQSGLAAETVRQLHVAGNTPGTWAADDLYMGALFFANGIPAISGVQSTGPEVEKWLVLDPEDRYRTRWNRGSSFIWFEWDRESTAPVIENPHKDVVLIRIDPCSKLLDVFALRYVVSLNELSDTCLEKVGTVALGGAIRHAYERT